MNHTMLRLFLICLLLIGATPAWASTDTLLTDANPMICGADLNGNGDSADEGETAACVGSGTNKYCPIGAQLCLTQQQTTTYAPTYQCSQGTLNGTTCVGAGEAGVESHVYSAMFYGFFCPPVASHIAPSHTLWWGGEVIAYGKAFGEEFCTQIRNNKLNVWFYINGGYYSATKATYRDKKNEGAYVHYDIAKKTLINQPAQAVCNSGDSYNGSVCETSASVDVCPLGSGYSCVANGAAKYCSANTCINKNDDSNSEDSDVDTDMLTNDGETDDTGACLDNVYIYSGRASRCKKSGLMSAFQNCCKSLGKVMQDGAGPYTQVGTIASAAQTIKNLYSVASEAYETYEQYNAIADLAYAASDAAVVAAQEQLMATFNPWAIAAAIAMKYVMEWVASACDQTDMETAMQAASGNCIEIGTYCMKKIKFMGCVQKARSFCCFNSKLARIIQEQGRPQLTSINTFGTPKDPQCRGFTPEEFQNLDFSQIDLQEYIDDLQKNTESEIQENIKSTTEEFYNKVM